MCWGIFSWSVTALFPQFESTTGRWNVQPRSMHIWMKLLKVVHSASHVGLDVDQENDWYSEPLPHMVSSGIPVERICISIFNSWWEQSCYEANVKITVGWYYTLHEYTVDIDHCPKLVIFTDFRSHNNSLTIAKSFFFISWWRRNTEYCTDNSACYGESLLQHFHYIAICHNLLYYNTGLTGRNFLIYDKRLVSRYVASMYREEPVQL